jgi:hypothetical protein
MLSYGKPIVMQAFGLVRRENVFTYYPFDSAKPRYTPSSPPPPTFGVTDDEQIYAFNQWLRGDPILFLS